ncbi:MAG TPA: hydrolase TatD, partial [Clostridiales bacterium]|nr:hydrolase TatD [Clostridiales bacterium]
MLIDSHAHLNDERFDDDREQVINSLIKNGIELVLNPGYDLESSKIS